MYGIRVVCAIFVCNALHALLHLFLHVFVLFVVFRVHAHSGGGFSSVLNNPTCKMLSPNVGKVGPSRALT